MPWWVKGLSNELDFIKVPGMLFSGNPNFTKQMYLYFGNSHVTLCRIESRYPFVICRISKYDYISIERISKWQKA